MKKSGWLLMFSAIIAVAALTAGATGTDDSTSKCTRPTSEKNHYFTLGGVMIDNSAITGRMEALGFPGFSKYAVTMGFGGLRHFGRYVTGGEIEALMWKRNSTTSAVSSFSAGRLMSLHGIDLVKTPAVSLYPLVGAGAGYSMLKARNKSTFDASFGEQATAAHSDRIHQMTFLVDLGAGLQLTKAAPQGGNGAMTISVRAGYIIDPLDNTEWRRGEAVYSGGPHSDLSGPYLKLTIGHLRSGCGGGDCKDMKCCARDKKCPHQR